MLRLFWVVIAFDLLRISLRGAYSDRTEDAANQITVKGELIIKQKRVEYSNRLTRNQAVKSLKNPRHFDTTY